MLSDLDDLFDYSDIDKDKTITTIKKLLEKYHTVRRLAGISAIEKTDDYFIKPILETESISGLTDDLAERLEQANNLLNDIHSAINSLTDEPRKVIYLKYLSEKKRFDYEIFDEMMISKNTYYVRLNEAYIGFSESFRSGKLIAYKNDSPEKDHLKNILS